MHGVCKSNFLDHTSALIKNPCTLPLFDLIKFSTAVFSILQIFICINIYIYILIHVFIIPRIGYEIIAQSS